MEKRKQAPARSEASLFGARLLALPTVLQHRVLRTAGRPTRRVCRQFCDAYGPLDGGLCLEHFSTQQELQALTATSSPDAFRHIRALVLEPRPAARPLRPTHLALLPTTFPTLRSLHLYPPITLTSPLIHLLAPLAPHLTSLTAAVSSKPGLLSTAALATTLTRLHTLSLTLSDLRDPVPHLLAALRPLAPTLRRLTCNDTSEDASPFPLLAPFSCLTHVSLPQTYFDWDTEAIALFPTILPCLEAFDIPCSFPLPFDHPYPFPHPTEGPSATPDDVVSALAAHTALTTLTLKAPYNSTSYRLPYNDIAFTRLAPLPLAHLTLLCPHDDFAHSFLDLLRALAPASMLTSLHVGGIGQHDALAITLPLLFADTLRALTWDATIVGLPALEPLGHLPNLQSLSLNANAINDTHYAVPYLQECAAGIANGLTSLTSFRLYLREPAESTVRWPLLLMRQLARSGALRHLALSHWVPEHAAALAPLATSLVRLTVGVPLASTRVVGLLGSLGHLRALRCLHIRLRQADDYARLKDWTWGADENLANWNMDPAVSTRARQAGGTGASATLAGGAGTSAMHAGDTGASSAGTSASSSMQQAASGSAQQAAMGSVGGIVQVLLPPGLRQLCLEVRGSPWLPAWGVLEPAEQEALLTAAARQDCVVRASDAQAPLSSLRLRELDDCNGYRDWAAAEFVEASLQQ